MQKFKLKDLELIQNEIPIQNESAKEFLPLITLTENTLLKASNGYQRIDNIQDLLNKENFRVGLNIYPVIIIKRNINLLNLIKGNSDKILFFVPRLFGPMYISSSDRKLTIPVPSTFYWEFIENNGFEVHEGKPIDHIKLKFPDLPKNITYLELSKDLKNHLKIHFKSNGHKRGRKKKG